MSRFIAALIVVAGLLQTANAAMVIEDAKARATFAMAATGAVYLTLNNQNKTDDKLVAASVPETVAKSVEIHTVVMQDGMMKMRELPDGIAVKASEKAVLKPGGFHIMLMGLKSPLNAGESISLTLHFESSKVQTITVPIVKM